MLVNSDKSPKQYINCKTYHQINFDVKESINNETKRPTYYYTMVKSYSLEKKIVLKKIEKQLNMNSTEALSLYNKSLAKDGKVL